MILGTLEVDLDISHIFSTSLHLTHLGYRQFSLSFGFDVHNDLSLQKASANVPLLFEHYKEASGLSEGVLFHNLFYFSIAFILGEIITSVLCLGEISKSDFQDLGCPSP
jgi:hypothetical protein